MHRLACLSVAAVLSLATPPLHAGEAGTFAEPLVLPSNSPVVHGGCDFEAKSPTLAADGTFRCDGAPFSIRLPVRDSIQQIYGNNYLSLQHVSKAGVLLVSFIPAITELDPRFRKKYRATLPSYPERLLRSVGVERIEVGPTRELNIAGADYAVEMTMSTGPLERPIEGTARVLISRGWMVFLMASGDKSQKPR